MRTIAEEQSHGTIHNPSTNEKPREFYQDLSVEVHGTDQDLALADILDEVVTELAASNKWGPFNSAHEGFAVMHEEFDELKAHVWTNQNKRDLPAMRKEAKQVAAMAIKFMQMIDGGRGRK